MILIYFFSTKSAVWHSNLTILTVPHRYAGENALQCFRFFIFALLAFQYSFDVRSKNTFVSVQIQELCTQPGIKIRRENRHDPRAGCGCSLRHGTSTDSATPRMTSFTKRARDPVGGAANRTDDHLAHDSFFRWKLSKMLQKFVGNNSTRYLIRRLIFFLIFVILED